VISRRDLLKQATTLWTGAIATPNVVRGAAAVFQQRGLRVGGRDAQIAITAVTPLTLRISVTPAGATTGLKSSDGALTPRSWPAPAVHITGAALPEKPIRVGTSMVRVALIGAEPPAVQVRVATADGREVLQLTIDGATGAVSFPISGGPLLGLGEGGPQFDRRGSADRMRSGQGGYQLRTHGGRVPIPWLIGTQGWALFFHQPLGTFDFTTASGRFDPASGADALPLDIFMVNARDPVAIMGEYAKLTGFPAMPPLWSLGYQQSHRTLASRDEIMQEAQLFREKKLPCDTMIYLGTGFCPSGWNTDNGEFTFNPKVFPDPAEMIKELHDEHFKVALHVVLEGRRLTGTVDDPCTAAPVPSGRTPDGRWPDDRQVSCYWPAHKPLFDVGVDGWWPDQGDGLDAESRLARIRMYWDGARKERPTERPYVLHRNGQAGMQRYGAFLWSGDVYSTWETLKTHVPVAINTGLTGVPMWGTDIGGFVPTKELTGELYLRWFQFAAFCPLFRAHGRTWKLRLPWGWNTGDLAPDEISTYTGGAANPDPSELHNAAVEPICRKYLELRYRLLPYLYSAVREAHVTGLPIMRALWLHYPEDAMASARGDQYLWGRDMLVAPVTEKGAASRAVYLPNGRWYDFWQEAPHDGGREIQRTVDLETMPLFVRAGAILPLGPVKQYTSEPVDAPLELRIYPGADGAFTLYDDDGETFDYERGDWMGMDMRWTDRNRRLALSLTRGSRVRPPSRRLRVRVVGTQAERDVVFSGSPIEVTL
jgi:alpha-glucosidase/alpha-D-xyloside xylohydrolase